MASPRRRRFFAPSGAAWGPLTSAHPAAEAATSERRSRRRAQLAVQSSRPYSVPSVYLLADQQLSQPHAQLSQPHAEITQQYSGRGDRGAVRSHPPPQGGQSPAAQERVRSAEKSARCGLFSHFGMGASVSLVVLARRLDGGCCASPLTQGGSIIPAPAFLSPRPSRPSPHQSLVVRVWPLPFGSSLASRPVSSNFAAR
jgi:hypothetical protein